MPTKIPRPRIFATSSVLLLLLVYLLNPFDANTWSPISRLSGFQPFKMPTASMEPTIAIGSAIVVNSWPYLLRDPRPTEVAVFRFPVKPSVLYIKRIIASGGSTVSIEKCIAIVDGKPLIEPYVVAPNAETSPLCTYSEVLVPNGQYFVLNDNRSIVGDSRLWGFVPQENFIARFGQ